MTRLTRVTAGEVIRVLVKLGFELSRTSGSHRIYRNQAGRRVTVQYHTGKVLHPRLLKSILDDAGLSVDELRKLL